MHALGDPRRRRVDQLASPAASPGPLRHRLVVRVDHLLRLLDVLGRRREDVVGKRNLVGVAAPAGDGAEGGAVGGLLQVGP